MKRTDLLTQKMRAGILLLAIMLSSTAIFAQTYTATVAGGDWSTGSTWVGGTAPSFNLTTGVAVIIPTGATVIMDGNVSITGALASLEVEGTLSSGSTYSLTVGSLGTLSGAGAVNIGTLDLQTGSAMSFTGSSTVGTMNTAMASLQLGATISVSQMLNLSAGTLSVQSGGSIIMNTGSTIDISGGLLGVSGGSLMLTASYNVAYTGSSTTTGVELSGSGLNNVTVNVSGGNTVTMASDLAVNGALSLTSGSLVVGANTLTINGNVTVGGSGTIISTALSNITVNTTGGTSGSLSFGSSSSLNNFTVNVASGNQVMIDGSVDVMGTLALTGGTLNFSNGSLTISGAVTGTGNLSGNSAADLTINTSGGLSGAINFVSTGQSLNNLTVNVGSGNSVSLGSNLSLAGTLTVSGGNTLNISGDTLAIAGGLSGSGSIMTNSATGIMINTSAGLTGTLNLSGTSIGTLSVGVGAGNSMSLGSNLNVATNLDLQSGTLNLNSYNLTLGGMVSGSGNGSLTSTTSSNISINTTGGIGGTLIFATGSSVNNLTVNVGNGNQAQIGGSLDVTGVLALTGGTLNFAGGNLTIGGSISGSGNLSGNNTSNLTVNSTGGLTGSINFATGGQMVNNLTVDVGSGNTVTLGTGLGVAGTLDLSGGSNLDISGNIVTVGGNLTGTGTFTTNGSSGLVFNTTGSLTSAIDISGTGIGTLTINVGAGNTASLGANITVTGALNLQSGTLTLNGYDITLAGTVSGAGNLSSTSASNITINTTGGIGGVLNFASGSSVYNFIVNVGSGNQVQIGGSLDVTWTLQLTSGSLNFSNSNLTLSYGINGSGMLSSNSSGNLTVNASGGLTGSGSLNFATGGQMVGNFTVSVGSGNSVTLGTGLTTSGTLDLSGGSNLNIDGDTIVISGALNGTGSLVVDSTTTLIINTSGGLSTPVVLSGSIGSFVLNVGSGNSVTMGSNLSVSDVISLQSGMLILSGNNLNITGDIAGNGTGTISSGNSSNITVNTVIATTGGLSFSTGANSVGNLSIGTGGSLAIGSNLNVAGGVNLTGGTVNIGSDTLNLTGSNSITGSSNSSYIIASGSGALELQVTVDTGWVNFPVGTSANYAPIAVELNTGSSSAGMVYVSVNGGVLAQGTTGTNLGLTQPLVDVTWMVEPTVTSNINVNLMTMWSSALQINGFNPDSAYVSHFTGGAWSTNTISAAAIGANSMYQLQLSGITSFSPFAVFGGHATTTAITDVADNSQFEVYPNPASDNLIVKNVSGADLVYVEVVDMTGQIIANYQLTNLTTNISLSGLSAGNYLLKLYNSNMNVVKQFIKL